MQTTGDLGTTLGGRVTLVYTTFNSGDVIGASLASVARDVPVVVVDNLSSDGTAKAALAVRPDAVILRQSTNQGFGRACNDGLGAVTTEFAVIVNPDLTLRPGCLEACLAAAVAHPDAAILGSAVDGAAGDVVSVDKVPGCFMMLRMSAFADGVFFDPNIFMYYEDDDICMRARAAGHAVVAVSAATVDHAGDGSTAPAFDSTHEKQWLFGAALGYMASKYADLAIGRKFARKLVSYWRRSFVLRLTGRLADAERLRLLVAGARAVERYGPSVQFSNLFTGHAPRHADVLNESPWVQLLPGSRGIRYSLSEGRS